MDRKGDARRIILRINIVLLCPPFSFWEFLRLAQGHLPGKNLPAGDFSRSTIVPIFQAHYLTSVLVKWLLYITDRANDGITVYNILAFEVII